MGGRVIGGKDLIKGLNITYIQVHLPAKGKYNFIHVPVHFFRDPLKAIKQFITLFLAVRIIAFNKCLKYF